MCVCVCVYYKKKFVDKGVFMVVYGIESYKKRNKKIIIFIVILSIVIVGTAIFGGIKTAQYVAMKKQEENDEQN